MGFIVNMMRETPETAGLLSGRFLYVNAEMILNAIFKINGINDRLYDRGFPDIDIRAMESGYLTIEACVYNIFSEVGEITRYNRLTNNKVNFVTFVDDYITDAGISKGADETVDTVKVLLNLSVMFNDYFTQKQGDFDFLETQLYEFFEFEDLDFRNDIVPRLMRRMGAFTIDEPVYIHLQQMGGDDNDELNF